MKLRYLESILQFRLLLLETYCTSPGFQVMNFLVFLFSGKMIFKMKYSMIFFKRHERKSHYSKTIKDTQNLKNASDRSWFADFS